MLEKQWLLQDLMLTDVLHQFTRKNIPIQQKTIGQFVFFSVFLKFLIELFKKKSCVILITVYSLFYVDIERVSVLNMIFLSFSEKCKMSFNKKEYAGAALIDLSKTFDTINHKLLIPKLYVYGFFKNALTLLLSYISDRQQMTKIIPLLVRGRTTSRSTIGISSWRNFIRHFHK